MMSISGLPKLVVVTGTDTNVGKTHISQGFLRALVRTGHDVVPLKLIETGCSRENNLLLSHDGLALARAASQSHALDQIAPERFELAAAPATAARHANKTLRFVDLVSHIHRAAYIAPRVLLEGAGGFLVPIGPDGTFGDLVEQLRAPVVLVARDALGTLNHTLLTAEAILRRGLSLKAIILNSVGPQRSPLDHAEDLRRFLPAIPLYGPLPWHESPTPDRTAHALETRGLTAMDLSALWDRT